MNRNTEAMHLRRYPDTSFYHRKSVKGSNYNIWRTWLYQREIGSQPPLGFRDRQNKDTYAALYPVNSWTAKENDFNHGAIFNLEFSPDGKLLVAACESKSFLVFDPLNGRLVKRVMHAHTSCVNCVRFLDSRLFATCSDDTTVSIWDIRFPKNRIRSLRGHSNWVKNIEYAHESRLLVTSGFDGSVFVWDINRYTDDISFKQVCHVNGLMRTKLTPDETKLVMCTTAGYLMIIHDLDLTTLARDLNAFNPNAYRLMQLTGQATRKECGFNHLFSSNRKRNRVEFISDFPDGNTAEIISSLQIHPEGWCVLSRNTSSDKRSEWTCVHELQDYELNSSSDDDNYTSQTQEINYDISNQEAVQSPNRPVFRFHVQGTPSSSTSSSSSTDNNRETNQPLGIEVQLTNSELLSLLTPSYQTIQINGSQLVNALARARTAFAEEQARENERDRPNQIDRPAILLRAISQLVSETDQVSQPNTSNNSIPENTDDKSASCLKIRKNKPRLTHYCKEMNVGQGFIKELCFSADGRLVCSPFVYGIRLFAFDSDCHELCDSIRNKPQQLYEVTSNLGHNNVVVSTKYSPTHPLIVSGCLDGKICFHQPVLP